VWTIWARLKPRPFKANALQSNRTSKQKQFKTKALQNKSTSKQKHPHSIRGSNKKPSPGRGLKILGFGSSVGIRAKPRRN
jgi:hypothetical protein